MGEKKELKVTTLEDLKKYAEGFEVDLPPFATGDPLRVILKRPSVVELARNGTIPNELLGIAMELFTGDDELSVKKEKTPESKLSEMVQFTEVLKIVAKESLVSPSYDDFVKYGVTLTDEQLLAIYNFTQTGVKDMHSFRP